MYRPKLYWHYVYLSHPYLIEQNVVVTTAPSPGVHTWIRGAGSIPTTCGALFTDVCADCKCKLEHLVHGRQGAQLFLPHEAMFSPRAPLPMPNPLVCPYSVFTNFSFSGQLQSFSQGLCRYTTHSLPPVPGQSPFISPVSASLNHMSRSNGLLDTALGCSSAF